MDLFTVSLFKRKPVRNARDYVYENRLRIVAAYQYYTETPTIPSDASFDEPLGTLIERFICEYVERMHSRNQILIEEESVHGNRRLEMFVATYDDRDFSYLTREMLAEKFGLTSERIRQLLKGKENTIGVTSCRTLIDGSSTCDDLIISPILQGKYYDLLLSNQKAYSVSAFDVDYGISNDKTRRFLLDIIGYSICDSNIYFEPLVVKGENITALNHSAASFVKFFSDNALFLSLEDEVYPFLQDKFPDNGDLVAIFLDIARSSEHFESIRCENGQLKYGLKWQYLMTFPSRIARILYDNQSPMFASDVCAEYNRRAQATSIQRENDISKFTRKGHKLIETIGKTTKLRLVDTSQVAIARGESALSIIDKFIRMHNGKCTIDEVMEYLDNNGYSYQVKSVKTYMSRLCRAVKNHDNLYIHEDYISRYPEYSTSSRVKNLAIDIMPIVINYLVEHEGKARMKELTDVCLSVTGNSIRDTSLRVMLDSYPEIIGYEAIGTRSKNVILLLSKQEVDSLDLSKYGKKGPDYHRSIISTARQMLESSPQGILPIKQVYEVVVKFVPEGNRTNVVYKLLNNCEEFETYTLDKKRFVRLKSLNDDPDA